MLTTAERLVRRAALRILAWRSRYAWRRYRSGANMRNYGAREAVWQVWLASPDERAWRLLREDQKARAVDSAMEPDRTAESRAAIGVFCTAHGLVPEEPAGRALFFVLTGQHGQHRAADPDGSLLSVAYQAADEPVRAAVRAALAGSGDLDLVAVVARARREGLAEVTGGEADYLAGELARRRDWAGLWRLVLDLPLVMTGTAMACFGAGWRPDGESARALFERLARVAGDLAAARDALLHTQLIEVPGETGPGSFSPDGRWLAVTAVVGGSTAIFGYERDVLVRQYRDIGTGVGGPLAVGEACFASRLGADYRRWDLVRFSEAGEQVLLRDMAYPAGLAPHPAGCVALLSDRCALRFYDDHGRPARDEVSIPVPGARATLVAADGTSGRLAVASGQALWVVAMEGQDVAVLGRIDGWTRGACFAGVDRVVTTAGDEVRLHRLTGGEARLEITTALAEPDRPVSIPARDEIALLHHLPGGTNPQVGYLDARTLQVVRRPREFTGRPARYLWGSPDGRRHAIGTGRQVGVARCLSGSAILRLADLPLSALRPADVATLTAAAVEIPAGSPARPLADALAAGLEYRFGAEVALADGPLATAGADDIGLTRGRHQ